jgi:type IV pilus assembly protein PilO
MAEKPAGGGGSALSKVSLPGKIGIGVLFAGLIAFAYWFMFYSDVSKKITAAKRQQGDLKNELNKQKQAQESYFADLDELKVRQQRAKDFNKVLPSDTQQAAFLSAIQTASNTSGIDLKAYYPQEEQIQTYYAKVPMRLEVTGRFHQITKFAHEIGKLDRIINLENIELTDPKAKGDEVVLTGRCLATAFHTLKAKDPNAPPGGAPAPGAPK